MNQPEYPTNSLTVLILLCFSLTMAALAILFFSIYSSQKQIEVASINSRARAEIGLCIFSVSPVKRTPDYVKGCYSNVETKFQVKVDRYGDGKQ